MRQIPVVLVFKEDLVKNKIKMDLFSVKYVQVRKTATYSDLKKRIADCCSKLKNFQYKQENIRIWSVGKDEDLIDSLAKV